MELLLLLGLSLSSGALVLGLLAWADRDRLDRAGAVSFWLFPLVGALSVLPGFLLYGLAFALVPPLGEGRWALILFTWTINAPVEELAKFLCFAAAARLLGTLKEPHDGILQGAATGLGFALVENFLYGLGGGWQLLLLRSLVSLPGHVIYGSVWGGYYGYEHYQGRGRLVRAWVPWLALVPAAFSHAAFNTLALFEAPLTAALAVDAAALALGLFLYSRLRNAAAPRRARPLRHWKLAIPELEHALALSPGSALIRRRLAAYHLAAGQPGRALDLLEGLPPEPWTLFYRDAAARRIAGGSGPLPASSALNPALFRTLSGD